MPHLAVLSVLSAASSPCPDLNLIHYITDSLQPIHLMHSYLRELFFDCDDAVWYRFEVDLLRDIRAALPWAKPTLNHSVLNGCKYPLTATTIFFSSFSAESISSKTKRRLKAFQTTFCLYCLTTFSTVCFPPQP